MDSNTSWINAKDKLPPFDELVITCCKGHMNIMKCHLIWESCNNTSNWYPASENLEMQPYIYWMPLPTPPIEVDN